MKFSIITAVYNRRETIAQAVRSLQGQTHADHEHIVMDAVSTDGTQDVLANLADPRMRVVSERDAGIYDALNKGMARATGDVIGILHSDDFLASADVLSAVADAFKRTGADAVYGDLHYVAAADAHRVIRYWKSGEYHPNKLRQGWMPPHPALFIRRKVYEQYGGYDISYRIAADYDAILRWFGRGGIHAAYVPQVLVKMRAGGISNRSLANIIVKSREDYRALRSNGIGGVGVLARKNVGKVGQFLVRKGGTT